ncbi:hypothetical protein BH09PSE6_BH09PSE6_13910 [soil metagenome]
MDALDHLVVNSLFETDAAAAIFEQLGFQLTPRGHHSLGSINHLMMLPGCYLELVGLPLGTDRLRAEVLESALGINGLVLGSSDVEATRRWLESSGFHPSGPVDFSRPVLLDGIERQARFRTVKVAADEFAAGRVYWCQHETPELVWRPEWLVHLNGFASIDSLVVECVDPQATARRYAAATRATASQTGAQWTVALDGFSIVLQAGRRERFTRIGLGFNRFDELLRRANACAQVSLSDIGPEQARLSIASLDLVIDCRAIR